MDFPPRFPAARRSGGFTLIELLVVITIVAILAGILMSVLGKAQDNAKKTQVVSDMHNAVIAITAYYTDYHKYPLNNVQTDASTNDYGNGTFDTVYGNPGKDSLYSSADLFNILRAQSDSGYNSNNALNPNQTVYWEGQPAKSTTAPRDGITTAPYNNGDYTIPKGAFVDPWGHEYVIWFDANKDDDMSVAINWFYKDSSPTVGTMRVGDPPLGVAWASLGPDGTWGTKSNLKLKGSDDIVSWR